MWVKVSRIFGRASHHPRRFGVFPPTASGRSFERPPSARPLDSAADLPRTFEPPMATLFDMPADTLAAVAALLEPSALLSFAQAVPTLLSAPSPTFPAGILLHTVSEALAGIGLEAM